MRRILGLVFTSVTGMLIPVFCYSAPEAETIPNQVIVKFVNRTVSLNKIFATVPAESVELISNNLDLYMIRLKPAPKISVRNAIRALEKLPEVVYANLDSKVKMRSSPNDPSFDLQWNFANLTGKGSISADQAWNLGVGGKDIRGNDIVIAIVDEGFDYNHTDLKPNVWINQAEIPNNGLDDDDNGFVDDYFGWDAYKNTGANLRTGYHATHVAGTAGAKGSNSLFVTGINWDVKLMSLVGASVTTSVVVKAYDYLISQKKLWLESKGEKGANIVVNNSSFGVDYADCKSPEYQVWNELYDAMGRVGILSAVATANMNIDVDAKGDVPSGCESAYVISVTNTNRDDVRGSSGFGKLSIDLSAPGTQIFSTLPNNKVGLLSGTSMATPHVAGAVGFLHSVASSDLNLKVLNNPSAGALAIKQMLLSGVDPIDSLKDITVSGGRLNLFKAATSVNAYKE